MEIPNDTPSISTVNVMKTEKQKRELVYYCDGSYSHWMQIGYSGFRASHSENGLTETEICAAYLAIQYAL